MKVCTNENVIRAWQNGVSARNHRESLTSVSFPNGRTELFSYELKIGERTADGQYILADYTAPVNEFRSQTTSCHVNLAKYMTGNIEVLHPRAWEVSPFSFAYEPF